MTTVIEAIEIGNGEGELMTVTMRGTAENIVKVLVEGLPREALEQIRDAMSAELVKRRGEA